MNKKSDSVRVVDIARPSEASTCSLPEFSAHVQAGFPSPADDYIERQLDLHELMVAHPAATFFVRVQGDSMRDAGIQSGDILVVDRSVEAVSGKIVVAVIDGEFTVKRFVISSDGPYLLPENSAYPKLKIEENTEFQIWGVVQYVIHKTV